jgi:hypothetical protein
MFERGENFPTKLFYRLLLLLIQGAHSENEEIKPFSFRFIFKLLPWILPAYKVLRLNMKYLT